MELTSESALVAALAAVWLTAGILADALPEAATGRVLHQRTGRLLLLIGAGTTVLLAVPLLAAVQQAGSAGVLAATLPAVPAVVALAVTLPRLARLRRGTAAFVTAPHAPTSPALRAAAAHPLLVTPLQVTGLAALAATPISAKLIGLDGSDVAGLAVTFVALAVAAIGVRHALRHNRLADPATPARTVGRSA